ncbi:ATPase domain-containing protein [Halogeometricum limi]|uniref:Flagellar protein FlaH n=1 Tax=Halogeometricum limi TaxID=555875 RepID=A0A1I6GP12_9EURY|nr:ATPase domain-containing protein [Halogeometricum limi]SFR43866.1 flagellar protein FlaH [Halogeometricum limi]
MKSNHFSLGLQQHDRLQKELGGGIPKGSIVLIEGDYGAGKSVLSQRFTYGFSREDIVTSLISTELGVRGFLDQMHSLSYDMVKPLLDEEVLFIPAEIDASGTLTGGASKERKQLLRRLMEAETLWEADVTIIDTFDAILRNDPQFEALVRQNEERQAALEIISFFRELTTKGKTIILTVDPSTVDDDAIGPFRSIADVYLQLEMVEVGNDVRRNVFVKRFAGMGEQVGDRIGFSVRSGIGIVIESRSVA